MIKKTIYFILLINSVFCYKFNFIRNTQYNKSHITRRKLCSISPLLITFLAYDKKNKSIDELREEATRIIEIIEAQKDGFNLPKLKEKELLNTDSINNKDIEYILINILDNFKNNDSLKSLNNLKNYCSDSNYIKNTATQKLKNSFNDSKYAILLAKFQKYEILNFKKYNIDNEFEGYEVDTKIFCDYKTMIYNSIQFNDMHYPKENEKETLYYVIYRWNFAKQNNNSFKLESCYLVPNN